MICKYFLRFCEPPFHFLGGVLRSTKYFSFGEVLFIYLSYHRAFGITSKKHCLILCHEDLWLCFPLSFTVLTLTFRSLNSSELFWGVGCEVRVPLHSFACGYLIVTAPLIKDGILSSLNYLVTFVKNQLATNRMVYL